MSSLATCSKSVFIPSQSLLRTPHFDYDASLAFTYLIKLKMRR